MKEELAEIGLHPVYSEAEDREPIDFEIRGNRSGELYATVWGSHPTDDVQVDCEHDFVDYIDDETVGECPLCGATCYWHWEIGDGGVKCRMPHEWVQPEEIGGIIGRELKRLQKDW